MLFPFFFSLFLLSIQRSRQNDNNNNKKIFMSVMLSFLVMSLSLLRTFVSVLVPLDEMRTPLYYTSVVFV